MKRPSRWTWAGAVAAVLLAGPGAHAADGATLYATKTCVACHGADGKAPIAPNYPKLAGQNAAYLAVQIKDIRDGKRTNGLAAVMQGMVAGLTDEEVDAIASYLAAVR